MKTLSKLPSFSLLVTKSCPKYLLTEQRYLSIAYCHGSFKVCFFKYFKIIDKTVTHLMPTLFFFNYKVYKDLLCFVEHFGS